MAKKLISPLDRVERGIAADIPQIYFNGFATALGSGDVVIVLERNGKPVATLNASFTEAKTLVQKIGELIASLEVGHEITQLRNDAKQLIDVFSDFGSPKDQRDNVYERVDRIKNSDHSVWLDNENLRLARKHFVHWCGVAQAWREQYGPTFRNTDDRDQTLHYLKDAANRLAAGWMGNLVRNQQPYDRSGGEWCRP